MRTSQNTGTLAIAFASLALTATAQDQLPDKAAVAAKVSKKEYSPYAGRNFPTELLFGDTHLHTAISVDAGTMCRVGQEDAFRFARGEEITTTHGLRAKLSRPLDFIVVTLVLFGGKRVATAPALRPGGYRHWLGDETVA